MSKNPLEQYLEEKTAAGRLDRFRKGVEDTVMDNRVKNIVRNAMAHKDRAHYLGSVAADAAPVAAAAGAGVAIGRATKKGDKKDGKEKKAGVGELLSRAKQPAFNAAVGGATMGALTAGTAAVSWGAKKLYDAITKKRDFRTMLEANPDLQTHLEQNPKFFNQVYSSLRTVNPQFASEPMIAGHYMRHMMEFPDSAGGKIELALQAATQSHSPTIDATMRGVLQGAASGLGRPHDPHADMEHEVRGLSLQRRKEELMAPPQHDPHAPLEQNVRGLKLQRDMDRLQEYFQQKGQGQTGP